jgi:hypothetical protein
MQQEQRRRGRFKSNRAITSKDKIRDRAKKEGKAESTGQETELNQSLVEQISKKSLFIWVRDQ